LRCPSDGREYAVRHPEMLLVAPRSLAVVDREGEIVTLDALHIVAIKNPRAKPMALRSANRKVPLADAGHDIDPRF